MSQFSHLQHVLEARSIPFDRDDVQGSFQSTEDGKQMSRWVDAYLGPETLLTSEELAFHKSHGAASDDGARVSSHITDEDLEAAISSLEASTASIEQQCKLLEAQKRALQDIQARNAVAGRNDAVRDARSTKLARERAQSEFEAAELSEALQARIEKALHQAESLSQSVQPNAERLLEKDDRLLDGLEKVLPKLAPNTNDTSNAEEVERLCQALTTLSTQEIHASIDYVYNKAVREHSMLANGHKRRQASQSLLAQRDSLRAELEELSREIDGLSLMAVENQYRSPISRALSAASTEHEADRILWTIYMGSVLQYLKERVEATTNNTNEVRAHYSALKMVSSALQQVMAINLDRQSSQAFSQSPVKASQKGLKPLRLVQANLSESHDPATQLLRQLDIHIAGTTDNAQLVATLSSSTKDKLAKMISLEAASERGMSEMLVESLPGTESDVENLLRSVYAYSEFGTVRLNDAADGIDRLETATDQMGEQMRRLNVETLLKEIRRAQESIVS